MGLTYRHFIAIILSMSMLYLFYFGEVNFIISQTNPSTTTVYTKDLKNEENLENINNENVHYKDKLNSIRVEKYCNTTLPSQIQKENHHYSTVKQETLLNPCHTKKLKHIHDHSKNIGKKRDQLTKCGDAVLPLSITSVPNEKCWPRLAILPSYPSSGNTLVRQLFTAVTGLIGGAIKTKSKVKRNEKPFFNFGKYDIQIYKGRQQICHEENGTKITNIEIPYQGRIALTKTHYPFTHNPRPRNNEYDLYHKAFKSGCSKHFVTHVIRLARNPGDHVLRKILRFDKDEDQGVDFVCNHMVPGVTQQLIDFHNFWSQSYSSNIPQLVVHYENFSNKTRAPASMQKILEFVDETELKEGGTIVEKMANIITDPGYKQGALLAQYCGLNTARKVHDQTKEITKQLGYIFDEKLGEWDLPSSTSSVIIHDS